MNTPLVAGYSIGLAVCTASHVLARLGKVKTAIAYMIAVGLFIALASCSNPTAPDPCAKPADPKGCTPPSCARPRCY